MNLLHVYLPFKGKKMVLTIFTTQFTLKKGKEKLGETWMGFSEAINYLTCKYSKSYSNIYDFKKHTAT